MGIKIVSDSSSNVLKIDGFNYTTVPLKISFDGKEYVDDENCDVYGMVNALKEYKGKSTTSCPNVSDWEEKFAGEDDVFAVTISSNLSGSYNAARIAKDSFPDKNIHVIDSLGTGSELCLYIDKVIELANAGKSFEEIKEYVIAYRSQIELVFCLESLANLANNGRVSPIVAKGAEFFGIRLVGRASDEGTLEPMHKFKGKKRATAGCLETMKELGYAGKKVIIDHVFSEENAQAVKDLILAEYPNADVRIQQCTALCSFYAELGGLVISFEKN